MGLGIFSAIHSYIPLILYLGVLTISVLAVCIQARFGIYFFIFIVPFTYALIAAQRYPFGNQLLNILFFAIVIGVFRKIKGVGKPKSKFPIMLLIAMYFLALINGLLFSGDSANIELIGRVIFNRRDIIAQWKNFIIMPILYFLTFASVRDSKQSKNMIYLIVIILFVVEWKFYSSYGWISNKVDFSDKVRSGQFGYLGPNEFASFLLNYTALCIGLFLLGVKGKIRILILLPICFGLFDIMYSFSRGAYLGLAFVLIFLSFINKKLLIGLAILVLCFTVIGLQILPQSVIQRIEMTKTSEGKYESSAAGRIKLWHHAMNNVFPMNPVIGVGYGIFKFIPDTSGISYFSPHSNYVETLVEQGVVGLCILLYLYYSSFKSGWRLYKVSDNNWAMGLGIGFCACVIGSFIANFFGNRWSYYQVMSYFWIIWGVVDRYYLIMSEGEPNSDKEEIVVV